MKRFLIFAGDNYYPSGGMRDFIGDYGTFQEAESNLLNLVIKNGWDWGDIWDCETREMVYSNNWR